MAELGDGNGSDYPGTLDTNNTLEVNAPNAGKTKARAEVPNDLAAAIVAIQTELGTDPAGTATDVKTRLDELLPAGVKMAFFQASAPAGWTQDTTHNDKALRVVSGSGGGSAGTLDFSSANVGDTTLTVSQTPSHSHTLAVYSGDGVAFAADSAVAGGLSGTPSTSLIGGGLAHNHSLDLKYIDVIIGTKD